MLKKLVIVFALAVAGTMLLSACKLSAGTPMPILATPTVQGANPVSQPTGISLVEAWGTSTAIYQQTAAAQGLLPATATPTTGFSFSTDTPTLAGFVPTSTSIVPPTGGAPTATTGGQPVIIVPTATPGRPATYTLQEGEFPYCIARRFNVNQQELLSINNLPDTPPLLQPGFVLKIPQTGNPFVGTRALHPHPTTYSVAVNDTIYAIACYFGDVDPTSIAAANGLSLSSPLTVGRVLNIP
ncbi:MAG TPA: LysM peptidoglycan-binding domain-containing protein [Anaerolineales bacterium]|nr:LysM peptidoglycan-binding domain-containing protein [Anaerolineales bacterium]